MIKVKYPQPLNCPELDGDLPISLQNLLLLIPQLQKRYGKNAKLSFYAGYNNVCTQILPTKNIKYDRSLNPI